jgi:hypothetical protein
MSDAGEGGSNGGTGGTSRGGTLTGGTVNGGSFSGGTSGTGGTSRGGTSGTSGTFTGGTSGTGASCGGFAQCGNQCVDIWSDRNHCGSCFYPCSFDAECIMGSCIEVCPTSTFCSGICTDLRNDPDHCGGCNVSCDEDHGGFCLNGACRCGGRQVSCGSGCADLQVDPGNCGACGIECTNEQLCADGACRLDCPSDFVGCDGECRNLTTDPDHCGACGNSCPRAQVCRDGACSLFCGPGITNCDGACRDLRVDARNCGACGRQCGPSQNCTNGMCTTIPNAFSYAVTTSPLSFVNACTQLGAVTMLRSVDDETASVMLPFSFRFHGVPVAATWVSSNGLVGFGSPTSTFSNECTFNPQADPAPNSILAFWDDLLTRTGGVCIATLGAAPNRQFVVTWDDALILASPSTTDLTFSVILNEGTDIIDVLYGTMSGAGGLSAGASASIGLSNATQYALECCNQPCVASNSGRRYTPIVR